jgi:hypothetical protein
MNWILPILLLSLVLFLCQDSVEAGVRDWDDTEISDILSDIQDLKDTLKPNGNISTVAADLREQLQTWERFREDAELLRDAVEDILEWLGSRRIDYIDFVGDIGNKCDSTSPCGVFRSDLLTFFQKISDLPPEIEAIQRLGLRDLSIAEKIINIVDEIDDPDIFSLKLNDEESLDLAITSSVGPLDRTKTQRYCRLRANRLDSDRIFDGVDPIRLNRLQVILTYFKLTFDVSAESLPDDVNIVATLLGEGAGTGIPNISKSLVKVPGALIELILTAIDAHRTNIDLCLDRFDEVESRIASCTRDAEFILDIAANEEYYDLVMRRLNSAFNAEIPTSKSVEFYNASINFIEAGSYDSAYLKLCDAYNAIGRGIECDPEKATDEENPVACNNQSDAEICNDGVDNDGDGNIDCADRRDCRRDPACN